MWKSPKELCANANDRHGQYVGIIDDGAVVYLMLFANGDWRIAPSFSGFRPSEWKEIHVDRIKLVMSKADYDRPRRGSVGAVGAWSEYRNAFVIADPTSQPGRPRPEQVYIVNPEQISRYERDLVGRAEQPVGDPPTFSYVTFAGVRIDHNRNPFIGSFTRATDGGS